MAGGVIPPESCRLTLRLVEIKLRVIEFVFGEDGQMTIYEIFRACEVVQANSSIIAASSKLVGRLGEENAWAHAGVHLQGASRILVEGRP